MKLQVYQSEDYIAIVEGDNELVGWSKDEWIEDPETVVPAIVNAVCVALTNPEELKKLLSQMVKDN